MFIERPGTVKIRYTVSATDRTPVTGVSMTRAIIPDGGGFITCHATLPGVQEVEAPAVCRGFFDSYAHLSNVLRIWSRLGGFDEIEPPRLHR